jgi:hypothetical protein
MSLTPPVNRVLLYFYLVITLGVGVAALIWPSVRSFSYAPLRDALFPNLYLPTEAGMPVTLVVAAPPALEEWLKTSASDFSSQNSLIQIVVTPLRGMDADRRLNTITSQPDIWIAEADFVRAMAGSVPYETRGSPLAQDSFVWVASKNQTGLSASLDWAAIAQASAANPQFRIAMPPLNSVEGMAACWSAAAGYHHQKDPGAAQISDPAFRKWLSDLAQAAPDRNKAAYDQLATRPPQVDVGLIQVRELDQLSQGSFFSQPPEYNPIFNYPFYIRSNWQNTQPDEAGARQSAAAKFRDYLLSAGPQGKLAAYNLQPARGQTPGQVPALDDSAVRALRFCWQ